MKQLNFLGCMRSFLDSLLVRLLSMLSA